MIGRLILNTFMVSIDDILIRVRFGGPYAFDHSRLMFESPRIVRGWTKLANRQHAIRATEILSQNKILKHITCLCLFETFMLYVYIHIIYIYIYTIYIHDLKTNCGVLVGTSHI